MSTIQFMKFCSNCGRNTLHLQQKDGTAMNLVNVILVVMTLGLWLIVWGLRQFFLPLRFPPQCSVCGKSSRGLSIASLENRPQRQEKTIEQERVPCPFCAELIRPEARVCRFCQRELPEQENSAEVQASAMKEQGMAILQEVLGAGSHESDQRKERITLSQSNAFLEIAKWLVPVMVVTFLIAFLAIGTFNKPNNAPLPSALSKDDVEADASDARVCDMAIRHSDGEWEKDPDFKIWLNEARKRGLELEDCRRLHKMAQQGEIGSENSGAEQVVTKSKKQMVQDIQIGLNALGYDAGPAGGVLGPRTRNAIKAFQTNQKFEVTGEPSATLLAKIETARTSQTTANSQVAKAPDTDTSVTSAYKVCSTFDGTGITSEPCRVSGWDQSVNVRINMIPSEARTLCGQVARKARDLGWDFRSGWRLKIYSPYSGDNTIAFCNL